MRKSILLTSLRGIFVLLILLPFSIYAQRVNEHGLKMVSEIEYTTNNGSCVELFRFKYDEENGLTRMSVYRKWIHSDERIERMKSWTAQERKEYLEEFPTEPKLYRDFVKTAEGLIVKDYDTYNYSPLRWEVSFDCYDNISSIAVFEEFERGSIKKDVFNFFYERDGIGYPSRLSRYNHTETSKRKGQKSWFGTSVGTSYEEMFYHSGFIKNGYPKDFERYKKLIDYGHVNDTNINLPSFFMQIGPTNYLSMGYFTLTEWLPCRSKYFKLDSHLREVGNRYESIIVDMCNFEYDDKGNLVGIGTISEHNRRSVKIKYLY